MAIKLRTKMAATHGMVALITIFLVVAVSYLLINERFIDYVTEDKIDEREQIAYSFSEAYQNGKWNSQVLRSKGLRALKRGFFITIKDDQGKILWKPSLLEPSTFEEISKELEEKTAFHYGIPNPRKYESMYWLKNNQVSYAQVKVTYFSTYFLTEHDAMFLKYLNTSLLWVAGFSFLLSLVLSVYVSSRLSSQLSRIVERAKDLVKGNNKKDDQLIDKSIVEILELRDAIDYLEEILKEKEMSNKRMSADIAHELRTPLSSLQSHIEALIEGIWEPTQDRLISCHEEVIRMTGLVKDLEQLNKYETSQIKLIKSNFDISELVKNIFTNFQSDFVKKNIEFLFKGDCCEIFADREKMGQVIVNLVSNSLKYTPEGGRVFISCTTDEKFTYIIINDNGIGIAQHDLPNIFNRLYRADTSRTRATGGAGIGLAIAKAIIEAHRGHIGVVSQVGKGTEVTVVIPKVPHFGGSENG